MTPWADLCAARIAALWAHSPAEGADSAHDMGHLWRVWQNCQTIAQAEGQGRPGVLAPAAFFHDLVNLPKSDPNRAQASTLSADRAVQELAAMGYPAADLTAVHHAIAAHSFSANIPAETMDARILQDADRLEALGAIGIARLFATAGVMGAALFDWADPMAQARPLDDRRHALDHLEIKLLHLADRMHTATGRRIAQARTQWMRDFRAQLLAEISPAQA